MLSQEYVALAVALVTVVAWAFSRRSNSVSHIRGPAGGEWLVGHEHILTNQPEAANVELQWFKEFGAVFKTKGTFNRDVLLIADPKVIQHIFHDTYKFPKVNDLITLQEAAFGGKGLVNTIGATHARQRKMLLPAFTAAQLRTFLGLFHTVAAKMIGKWNDITGAEGSVINIHDWLSRATLDVIGDSSFTYKFNSVEGDYKSTELGEALDDLFIDFGLYPARTSLVYNALLRVCAEPIANLLKWLPNRQNDRLNQFFNLSVRVVRRIIDNRGAAALEGEKDILSILLRAKDSKDPSKALSDTELIAQLTLMIIAGHDTTAATLTWMFWELAKDPKSQERIRAEIREHRIRVGNGVDFSGQDYDAMTYLNASLKEALRLHPVLNTLVRQASEDVVLPLAEPLMTKKGLVTGIPVSKNQDLQISLAGYNRLPSVWGEDAEKWNPDRWIGKDWSKTVSVGMTSNLMTFSGGVQGCIGWKFGYMEAQAMAAHMLETFEFSIPADQPKILRLPTAVMLPLVEGQLEKGIQMPLLVKPITY